MKLNNTDINSKANFKPLKTLMRYLWEQQGKAMRFRILSALALLLISKIFNVYAPVYYKKAVDALSIDVERGVLIVLPLGVILAYGAARIGAQLFNEIKDMLFVRVEHRAIRQIALETFEYLHALSLRFHLDRKTGGLSRSIERGTNAIETLLRFMVFNILPTIFEIIMVSIVLSTIYKPSFALVTLSILAIYIIFTISLTEYRTTFVRKMNQTDTEANTKAVDSLLNYETVKYFNNEKHEAARYDVSLEQYEIAAVKSKQLMSILNIGQGAIISLGLVIIMIMAASEVISSKMSIGDFVLVNTYLIQLYLPLNILGFAYREIKLSLINMEHMFLLFKEPQEVKDSKQAEEFNIKDGTVIFENVSFGYTSERRILNNISFEVPMGKTLAIVGPSGAGKSTISRLLFRFYDVIEGRILIDGRDIREITQSSLRKAIGIVPQDTVLFNDTIYYNISYGHPQSNKNEVIKSAKLAKIHDFIMQTPDQYLTTVGERGLKLSGGEKQRIAIARTLLKKPKIFLFDEATSALDTHTEKTIQENLREVSKGHTTIIIAHRLSTIVDADEILVVDQGKIIERGVHSQLLKQKGFYAQMWKRQLESKQILANLSEKEKTSIK
ncbi:MAG: metal ABC transporter permease [Caedibacter sp. 38-128]|nr:ABC transporter ATP-binding protein/permease [Holosporales bacterium]OJX07083.1 MAG: metal ABC transporter permease [Caedibacter sp. 38-128]